MIAGFRSAVRGLLGTQSVVPVVEFVPDDVANVPCVVVGRPDVRAGDAPTLFDLDLDLWVIGNRNVVGGTGDQLDEMTDEILATFGGTRSTSFGGVPLQATSVSARTVDIANFTYPCYTITVETTTHTC